MNRPTKCALTEHDNNLSVRAPGYTGPMRELTMRPTIKNGYSNDMKRH